MSKANERKPYVVVSRYRNGRRWREQGEELNLLPVEAQGPLSQGKIATPENAEKAIKAFNAEVEAREKKATDKSTADAGKKAAADKTAKPTGDGK